MAYFATDPSLSVATILEAVADRVALEQVFHDVKEVHGAGQQQLRHVWANVGAWNLIGWWHTLVELWAWHRPHVALCDRSESPWDKKDAAPRTPTAAGSSAARRWRRNIPIFPRPRACARKSAGSSGASCGPPREAGRSGKVQFVDPPQQLGAVSGGVIVCSQERTSSVEARASVGISAICDRL